MDKEEQKNIFSFKNKKKINISKINNKIKLLYFLVICIILINAILLCFIFINKTNKLGETLIFELKNNLTLSELKLSNLKEKLKIIEQKLKKSNNNIPNDMSNNISNNKLSDISNKSDIIFIKNNSDEEFEKTFEKYINEQNEFCNNSTKYYNDEFEKQIKMANVHLRFKNFKMYVYKSGDIVSNCIAGNGHWEAAETMNLLRALNHYSDKKNIKSKDIYIIDIGSNIGWYSFYLGKYNYKIISFEASQINNYILQKNYCLNKDVNLALIKKGLNTEEQNCDIYVTTDNVGNGHVYCNKTQNIDKLLNKIGEIKLTKLSNFLPLLSKKNIALIKIDVEGNEGRAIKSGVELITKYHIPFIFMEFVPKLLKLHETNPIELLKLFEDNGYKFAKSSFFDRNYLSIDNIIQRPNGLNIYIVHSDILN